MPIRIRFEHTRYPHWGGRSGYVQFVRELDPQRYQADLHGTPYSNEVPRWLEPVKPLLQRLIRRGRMPWYSLSDLNAELEAFAGCLRKRFDIVHFLDGEHSGQLLPRLIRLARLSAIKTVATFHQPPEVACEVVNGELLQWFDQIVLVSPSQLPFFKQYVSEDKLNIILHGVNIDFFHPVTMPNQTGRIRCITVGHHLRDWKIFSEVALRMSEFMFDVVTIATTEIPSLPNVRVHNGIDDVTLAGLYRSADILFLPLVQSTANNALLDGIACGLPVVVTDLEAVRAYLPESVGILVTDNRVEAFVQALRHLGRDVELRHKIGIRARMRAEELAWRRIVQHYETLYARIVGPRIG